jgi:predicted nuclease with TOPRIM domain
MNPFNEKIDKEKAEFFKEITVAINNWMLEKYPAFDSKLEKKINELAGSVERVKLEFNNDLMNLKKTRDLAFEECKNEIKDFIEKEYPDISDQLIKTSKELNKKIKSIDDLQKKIEEKTKRIKIYDTLCADVYANRDEMIVLKKEVHQFTDKMKKVFK